MLTSHRHPTQPAGLAPTADPIPDWSKLARADEVAVYRQAESVASGRIDMIAIDRSVFWVIQDDGLGRVMCCNGDGLRVFRRPPARASDRTDHYSGV